MYHTTDNVVTSTSYTYDYSNESHLLPMEKETVQSNGNTLRTEYIRDANPAILKGVDQYDGATQVSGVRRTLNGRLPVTISRWNKDLPPGLEQYENISTTTYDGNRPISQVARDGTEVVYVWGYNNEYPVVQVSNATLSEVQALISTTYQGYLDDENPNAADLRTLYQHLRTNLDSGLVTGYIYELGSGIIEMIDPNGRKQTYSYDGFRRLKDIKDNDGNFISAFQYMFQTQN